MTRYRSGTVSGISIVVLTVILSVMVSSTQAEAGNTADGTWYSVQVGSYKNASSADGVVALLKARGYDGSCRTVDIPDRGTWHRVLTGRYNSKDHAMQAGRELQEKGVIGEFAIVKTAPDAAATAVQREAMPPRNPVQHVSSPSVPLSSEKRPPPRRQSVRQASETGCQPYDSAMREFTAGRYGEALEQFRNITGTDRDEAVQRRMADCYYFLGEKGGAQAKGHYSAAIDQYRGVLRTYPGIKKENAQALYRLAGSYRHNSLHYEALTEFRNLCKRYPQSVYAHESLYMTGELLYQTEKYDGAVTAFKEYIHTYPEGTHAREAYFGLGNCYSRMRQFNDADAWYAGALKRFPRLENIPEDTLSQLGTHYLEVGKDDDALKIFFAYLNLFPDGRHYRDIMAKTAHFFERGGKLPLALKMLSLVVERYPQSKEAQEGLVAMANIGVQSPDLAVPSHILPGMEYYRDPIEAYDTMTKGMTDADMEEELIFRKGDALVKRGRYEEAYASCRLLSEKYPQGRYGREGEQNFAVSAGRLIDGHYEARDYIAVADIYFGAGEQLLLEHGTYDTLYKVGMSLKHIGLPDQASRVFREMTGVSGDHKRNVILALAEIDSSRGAYDGARKVLQQMPGTGSALEGGTAVTAERLMGDIFYRQGLFRKAADSYSTVLNARTAGAGINDVRMRYADSLRAMGLYSTALVNYERVVKNCKGKTGPSSIPLIAGSYEGLGDCFFQEGKYPQAIRMYEQSLKACPEREGRLWTIFNIGRGHAQVGNRSKADQLFSSLTETDSGEFWSRVVDYYLSDREWTEKYKDI